jgi:hypothetical protein
MAGARLCYRLSFFFHKCDTPHSSAATFLAQLDRSRIAAEIVMAAAARQLSPIELAPVIGALEMSPRPALELVPERPDGQQKGLFCLWRFDPAQRRLVAIWEQRSL